MKYAEIFVNGGGPLVAMDAECVHLWQGQLDTVHDQPAGDYRLACDSDYPTGTIPKEGKTALVIGAKEGIGNARWHSPNPNIAYLVGCVYANDGAWEELVSTFHEDRLFNWRALGTMVLDSGKLLLFHAACGGQELEIDPHNEIAFIGHALSVSLNAGDYELYDCEVLWPDKALFNVAKLVKN